MELTISNLYWINIQTLESLLDLTRIMFSLPNKTYRDIYNLLIKGVDFIVMANPWDDLV